jgi:PhnB protein
MTIKSLAPYLSFNGEAAQAAAFYERALGATVESMMRYGDAPGMELPEAQRQLVMHARLRLGALVLMMSDSPKTPSPRESNVHLSLDFDDAAELQKTYDALLEGGGKATMPVHQPFWGGTFGMLTDRYGVNWMFSEGH